MIADLFPEARVDPGVDLDRRYTTRETMALCMRLAGVDGWDLDVAADEESHWADRWYGIADDGLKQRWEGRVWCNPPYSDIAPWVVKAWRAAPECDVIAMLLPANRTDQPWWQELVEPVRDGRHPGHGHRLTLLVAMARLTTYFIPSRVRFGHPGNRDGVKVGSPPFGCVLLVWRRS